jgi:hypothetical protein
MQQETVEKLQTMMRGSIRSQDNLQIRCRCKNRIPLQDAAFLVFMVGPLGLEPRTNRL